ncbi:MAG: type I-D CRISPR-associated endonuclease Cas1d [Anaerolineales bacterium]|nr:type I-D CRISPR-associated endonuclease Cas1d [Anaerolineales bacterium]
MTTLYVTEPYSVIKKEGDTLIVHVPADEKNNRPARKVTLPTIKISEVVVLGDSTFTPQALAALLEQNVEITFLNPFGNFRGRMVPAESKNSLLRLKQFRVHEDGRRSFDLARQFVIGKLHNMKTLLLRSNRRLDDAVMTRAIETLRGVQEQVERLEADAEPPADPGKPQKGTSWGTLQGLEGAASAAYFEAFGQLLRGDSQLHFETRNRRPPRDPVNALLSYGYSLLHHQCSAALQTAHLDPYIGFLHSAQYGKPALALDLMEEFRAPVADSVVITLVNNRILKGEDFISEMGSFRLKDGARRTFLEKYEERMNTEITHPVFKYRATYRRCIELQARLLAKTIDGELETYVPFKVR